MAVRLNPFNPNSAVAPGMFVGRGIQLIALEQALLQTRAGSPKSFMLTGERGIGKTSLLQYFKYVAQGEIDVEQEKLKFLVVDLDIDTNTTDIGVIRRVELGLRRELAKTEPARAFFARGWEFLQRVEAAGVKLRGSEVKHDPETLHDEFAHSLATTTNRIVSENAPSEFGSKYDGVILLIDEADNASRELRLGALLKLLTERVSRHGCRHLMIGLAGMPNLRDVLRDSHASSLRIFDELPLTTLSDEEVNRVIDKALERGNELNLASPTTIDDGGRTSLVNMSEGYPHFIQQFGYSAFEVDRDGTIDSSDVLSGAIGSMGAMEKIGDRYYRDAFYNKIQKDSYRQVLRIMAAKDNRWVTKEEIRANFKGKTSTLDNALQALRDRKIILDKEGERGKYRLQQRAFALWIKLYTTEPADMQQQFEDVAERGAEPTLGTRQP